MSTVEIVCAFCGNGVRKDVGAVNESRREGRNLYCNKQCSTLGRRANFINAPVKIKKTKVCNRCGKRKTRTKFYPRKSCRNGLTEYCKPCTSLRVKERNATAERRAVVRAYNIRTRERRSERNRAWRAANIAKLHLKAKAKRSEHPEQWRAHHRVRVALRNGILKRPNTCSVCAGAGRIEAHHDDYDRPLDVRWLCQSCHRHADADRRAKEMLAGTIKSMFER